MDREETSFAARLPQGFLRRHRSVIITVLALLLAVFLLMRFVHHKQQQQAQETAQKRGGGFRPHLGAGGPANAVAVSVATVASGSITLRIPALGTITPLATVTVKTQISGTLQKILFKEGQLVRQGDPIALIDPRPYEATLAQMEGNLRRDQALLAEAKLDLKRYEDLITQDSVAQQQVDTQRSLVDQYIGAVASDDAQIKAAKVNLIYCHITSPVTGRVGLRQVDQGNYVQTNDTNGIVVITQTKPISVIFTVPEDSLPAIMARLNAGASLQVRAYDRSRTTLLATGTLTTVDNQIDTTTGMLKLRALFDNPTESLFANQFVNVQLLIDTLHDSTIVPSAAILRGAPGTFVYVIKPDTTVSVRPVKLGPTDGEKVAVASGLEPGESVVIDGADKLRDGVKVVAPNGSAGGTDAAAAGSSQKQDRQGRQRSTP
jgi:membrane fusion protein, multidrug efflux system